MNMFSILTRADIWTENWLEWHVSRVSDQWHDVWLASRISRVLPKSTLGLMLFSSFFSNLDKTEFTRSKLLDNTKFIILNITVSIQKDIEKLGD